MISAILIASNASYSPDSLIDTKSQLFGLIFKLIYVLDLFICMLYKYVQLHTANRPSMKLTENIFIDIKAGGFT